MVKRLKQKQKHNCDFCRREDRKTKAVWRNYGFSKCACNQHKRLLEERSYCDTEAEYVAGVP